jgi:hypothetical protein
MFYRIQCPGQGTKGLSIRSRCIGAVRVRTHCKSSNHHHVLDRSCKQHHNTHFTAAHSYPQHYDWQHKQNESTSTFMQSLPYLFSFVPPTYTHTFNTYVITTELFNCSRQIKAYFSFPVFMTQHTTHNTQPSRTVTQPLHHTPVKQDIYSQILCI